LAGWSDPLSFPGLLEEECQIAACAAGCDSLAISFRVGREAAAALRAYDAHVADAVASLHLLEATQEFPADNGVNKADEVSLACMLLHITKTCIGTQVSAVGYTSSKLWHVLQVAIPCINPVTRACFGLAAFGTSLWGKLLLCEAFVAGMLFGRQVGSFAGITAIDLRRRTVAMRMLHQLVTAPGVPVSELTEHTSHAHDHMLGTLRVEAAFANKQQPNNGSKNASAGADPASRKAPGPLGDSQARVHLDLKQPAHVFGYLKLRKSLRGVGVGYQKRGEMYAFYYMLVGYGVMLVINLAYWMQVSNT
jgi:hypothetical protein